MFLLQLFIYFSLIIICDSKTKSSTVNNNNKNKQNKADTRGNYSSIFDSLNTALLKRNIPSKNNNNNIRNNKKSTIITLSTTHFNGKERGVLHWVPISAGLFSHFMQLKIIYNLSLALNRSLIISPSKSRRHYG